MPEVVTAMEGVVAPVDQLLPLVLADVKITELPWQKVVGPFVVIAALAGGLAFTV